MHPLRSGPSSLSLSLSAWGAGVGGENRAGGTTSTVQVAATGDRRTTTTVAGGTVQ
jgi:hypothetical protein